MGQPNPFGQAPAPAPAPAPTAPATATPSPFGAPTTPAPVAVAPTQNPTTVDPTADAQRAAYDAWLAAQAAAPVAPPVPAPAPAQPPVDPAYAAWLAQQAVPAAPVAPSVPPAQFVAPPAAQSPAPAPMAPGADPFDDPAPQRPRGPRVRDMFGRLLIIIPKEVEKVSRRDPKTGETKIQDRLTADVVIVDEGVGGVAYGGEPEKLNGKPHDQVAQLPFRATNMFISAVAIISQCRDALDARKAGNPRMVLGRLTVGESKGADMSPPYLLSPATPEDRQRALAYTRTIDPFA